MSGHSKWATTKHKKAAIDAKRGKLFARLIKNIEVAARLGGGDPSGNPTLYDAIQKAKKSSVPNDNITRAVKRGSGEGADAVNYETIMYEAYGPAGVAILIECLTDNRNRAVSDVRVAVTRNGGTMADGGSVQRLFQRKGVVSVSKTYEVEEGRKTETREVDEDQLMEATIDAEPEDIVDEGEVFEIISDPSAVVDVRKPSMMPVLITTPLRCRSSQTSPSVSSLRTPASFTGSLMLSKISMTSRTCSPTLISPPRLQQLLTRRSEHSKVDPRPACYKGHGGRPWFNPMRGWRR